MGLPRQGEVKVRCSGGGGGSDGNKREVGVQLRASA